MKGIPLRLLAARLRRLGAAGMAGLALALAAVVFYFVGARPLAGEAEQARTRIAGLAAAGAAQPAGEVAGQADFWQSFPAPEGLEDCMAEVYAAAAGAGVRLEHGTYSLARDESATFVLYRIDLPVRGAYGQIRGFIAVAMNRLPTLALDEVSFKRENAGNPVVEARLKFTLYLRGRR